MRILIVDDDYVSRTKLKALISSYGDCDAVYDGALAVSFFERAWEDRAPYDLITMDVDMPGILGQDVVRKIRAWETDKKCYQNGKEVRILMISSMKDGKSVFTSFSHGCEAYLVKPVTPADIQKSLGELGFAPVKK